MAIIRWRPWNLSSVFEEDWDFPTLPGLTRLGQGLNIYETDNQIVAEAAVPGVSEEDIDVSVDEGVVRIVASTKDNAEETGKRHYYMSSMSRSFNYSFRLPEGMVRGDVEPACELDSGVLRLTFTKPEPKEPKKIQISVKSKSPKDSK